MTSFGGSGGAPGVPTWFEISILAGFYTLNWTSLPLSWNTLLFSLLMDFWKMSHVPGKMAKPNVWNGLGGPWGGIKLLIFRWSSRHNRMLTWLCFLWYVFAGKGLGPGFSLCSPGLWPSYWGTFILGRRQIGRTEIRIWERPPSRMRKRSPLIRMGSIQVPLWLPRSVDRNSGLELRRL